MNDCECAHIIDISNRQSDNPRNWIQTQQTDTNRLKQEVLCGIKSKSRCFRGSRGCRLQRVDRCVLAKSDRSCMYAVCPVCCIVCSMLIVGLWAYSTSAQGCDLSKFPQGVCNPPAIFGSWVSECLARKQRFFSLPFFSVTPQCHPQSWKELKTRLWSGKKRPAPVVPGWFLVLQCSSLQWPCQQLWAMSMPTKSIFPFVGVIHHTPEWLFQTKRMCSVCSSSCRRIAEVFFHQNLETWRLFFLRLHKVSLLFRLWICCTCVATASWAGDVYRSFSGFQRAEVAERGQFGSRKHPLQPQRMVPLKRCFWLDPQHGWCICMICIDMHWYALICVKHALCNLCMHYGITFVCT